MDDVTKYGVEYFGAWWLIIGPVVATVCGSIIWVARRTVSGVSYYVNVVWSLVEKWANKHFAFMDAMGDEQHRQTVALGQIQESTAQTSFVLSKMGSDPVKLLSQLKAELVQELIELIMAKFPQCKYDEAKLVAERTAERTVEERRRRGAP